MKSQTPPRSDAPPRLRSRANFHPDRLEDGRADVLIIEFNSPKLREEKNSVAKRLDCDFRDSDLLVATVRGSDRADLREKLLRFKGVQFSVIICIGHANPGGIHLACDDRSVTDGYDFSEWLEEFAPEQILLLGCRVLNIAFAEQMFLSIESLTDIYGTPTKTHPPTVADIAFVIVESLFDGEFGWGRLDTREVLDLVNEVVIRIPREVIEDVNRSLRLEERLERMVPRWEALRERRKVQFQGRRRWKR